MSLVRQTAYLEGFGDILDEGSLRLASRYVYPELAMVSKGMDFAGYDPRDALGMGLNYATLHRRLSHARRYGILRASGSPPTPLIPIPEKTNPRWSPGGKIFLPPLTLPVFAYFLRSGIW